MTLVMCPDCGELCEVEGDSHEELSVYCDMCQRDISQEVYLEAEADWIADQADRFLDDYKDRGVP